MVGITDGTSNTVAASERIIGPGGEFDGRHACRIDLADDVRQSEHGDQ